MNRMTLHERQQDEKRKMIEKQKELANAVIPKTERLYQKFEEESSSRLPNIR